MEYRSNFGGTQDRYIALVNKLADAYIEYNGDDIADENGINLWISENMLDVFDENDESTFYGLSDLSNNPNAYGWGTYEFKQNLINDAVDTVLSKNNQPMKQQIHLNEESLKGMIREAISEYVGEAYGDVRPNTQMMLDYIDDGIVDPKKVLTDLLDYISDDMVGSFMEDNGYTDGYSLEDDEEEEMADDMDNEELPDGVTPLGESELKGMIRQIIKETELGYDIDNFSGRWNKSEPEGYIDPEGLLDTVGDPFGEYRDEIVNNEYGGDEKSAENDYSWRMFNSKGVAPGFNGIGNISKEGVPNDIDKAITNRNLENNWTDRQIKSADKMKDRWVKGERSLDDVDDAFYGSSLDEAINKAIKKIIG